MIKPFLVNSDINFLLLGSINGVDTILIQSENLDIETIGIANLIFNGERDLKKFKSKSNVNYVWSDKINFRNRGMKFLFCWKENTQNSQLPIYDLSYDLNNFIENSVSIMREYMDLPLKYVTPRYAHYNSLISYNISILLLKCRYLYQ